jgi:hypothetical protein
MIIMQDVTFHMFDFFLTTEAGASKYIIGYKIGIYCLEKRTVVSRIVCQTDIFRHGDSIMERTSYLKMVNCI